jgi:pectate lyase
VTGGGTATPQVVTSLSALQSAVEGDTAAVIWVKGKLDKGDIRIGSNKTIAGICGASIGGHLEISGSSNLIIRNIAIVGYGEGNCSLDPKYDAGEGCSSGADAISVQNSAHHIWFDHCDISDGTDGNLDITKGTDYVTVSWTKFHYTPRSDNEGSDSTGASGHRYSNLVGGSDSEDSEGKLNITWHHNWWADNVVERQPRVRFGKNHVYNNYYSSTATNYAVRAGHNAHLLVEKNHFTNGDPHEFNSSDDETTAYITATDNTYAGESASGTQDTGGGGTPFTDPPYDYTADAVGDVAELVKNGAGPK